MNIPPTQLKGIRLEDELKRMNDDKVGRPFKFSDILMLEISKIKVKCRMSYRVISEFLSEYWGIDVSKSTIQRRFAETDIDPFLECESILERRKLDVTCDSTGLSPVERGTWKIIMHCDGIIREKKDYVKLSILAENRSKLILSAALGSSKVADSNLFFDHVEDFGKYNIARFFGDGAYDAWKVYHELSKKRIIPVIKPVKTARYSVSEITGIPRTLRDENVRSIRTNGYDYWRRKTGYGMRWMVESVFSSFKRRFGESIFSKSFRNISREIVLRIWIYNHDRLKKLYFFLITGQSNACRWFA